MKLSNLVAFNAILYIALGIAFALYGPLLIAMFGVLESGGDSLTYWYVVSFARLFGAALFGFGFLLWAIHKQIGAGFSPAVRRGVVLALLLAHILGFVVAITQQTSIWGTGTGWLMVGIFLILGAGYTVFLARPDELTPPGEFPGL